MSIPVKMAGSACRWSELNKSHAILRSFNPCILAEGIVVLPCSGLGRSSAEQGVFS